MYRRMTLMAIVLGIVMVMGAPVRAQSVTVSVEASDLTLGETLLLGSVGYAFNLDTNVLMSYRSQLGTVEGMVTLTYTSAQTGMRPDKILRERKKGRSWQQIVEASLPPGLRKKDPSHPGRAHHEAKILQGMDSYELETTVAFLADFYSVKPDSVFAWLEAGWTLEDVSLSLNVAARVRAEAGEVLLYRRWGRSWEWIASHYGLRVELLARPAR